MRFDLSISACSSFGAIIPTTLEVTYQAKADSRGGRLHAGCEYAIVMEGLDGGGWWSLAAIDGQGGMIPNAAEREAIRQKLQPITDKWIQESQDGRRRYDALVSILDEIRKGK